MPSQTKKMLKWLYTALQRLAEATGFGLLFQPRLSFPVKTAKTERFTVRSKQVLNAAYEEAQQTRHKYLMPEHVLLALLNAEGSIARQTLLDLNIQPEALTEIVKTLDEVNAIKPMTEVDLHPMTKRLLELAVHEARLMENPFIGTEHLLLGVARQESEAAAVLQRLGHNYQAVRHAIAHRLRQSPPFSLESYWFNLTTLQDKIQKMVANNHITPEVGEALLTAIHFEAKDLEITLDLTLSQLRANVTHMKDCQVGFRQIRAGEFQSELQLPLADLWAVLQELAILLAGEPTRTIQIDENTQIEMFIKAAVENG